MTNRAKLQRLPIVMTQLRLRAGFKSQNAAAKAIRKQTGVRLNKSQISLWERGKAMPSLASLLTFLEGLGYGLQDFQDELDRAVGEEVSGEKSSGESASGKEAGEAVSGKAASGEEASHPRTGAAPERAAEPPPSRDDLARRVEALEQRLRSLDDAGTGD